MKSQTNNNTEQHIIEVARQVFIEKGFEETSMSDIAAKAGINRSGLHYYFRTKDRLFEAVFTDIIHYFLPTIHQIILQDSPIHERISKITDVYFDMMWATPSMPMFVIREMQRDATHLLDTMRKVELGQYISKIKDALQKEMEQGRMRQTPFEFIPYAFYGLLFAPFILKPMTDIVFPMSPEDFKERMQQWKAEIVEQMCRLLCPN